LIDTENKVPGQLLASELVYNKIQDGGGRHIENHIIGHNSAIIARICTEFETQVENGVLETTRNAVADICQNKVLELWLA